MVKHSHESIGQWCASLKIRQQEKSTTIKERNAFTLKLLLCLKLHSSKRCSSYLDTDHQTNTNAKRRRFFPPWCLRCCCSSRCWAKCQIRRRGTRPGGAQGSARARPSQAPREILVSSSRSSSSGLGPDFLYTGPRRDAVLRCTMERHHAAHATAKHFMYDQGYTANIAPKNLYDTSASPIQQQPRCLVIHIQEEENWSTGRGPKPWWSTFSSQHWWEGTQIFFNILDIYIYYILHHLMCRPKLRFTKYISHMYYFEDMIKTR